MMKDSYGLMLPLLLLGCWTLYACADGVEMKRNRGLPMMKGMPSSQSRGQMLKRLVQNQHVLGEDMTQYAKPPPVANEGVDDPEWLELLTSPGAMDDFIRVLHLLQIPLDSVVPELPQVVQSELYNKQQEEDIQEGKRVFRLDRYHPLDEMVAWMNKLQQAHPDILEIIEIGKSFEGRPLYVTKFSAAGDNVPAGGRKKAIWMDAGIHSNEWIGPATMLFFMQQLVSGSEESMRMLEAFDWYIMPVFNVDGYVYTWNADRLWRKSRSEAVPGSGCYGVDLNRNWSPPSGRPEDTNPCSRTFPGKHPLSEPETLAVAEFLEQHNGSIVAYLAYHAFSQMWMTPYAYSSDNHPENYEELVQMAEQITDAIREVHGTQYKVGTVAKLIGETAGSSVDFTYRELGIRYSFGVELRDAGRYGTLLPPAQILPNCEESWAGIVKMAQLLKHSTSGNEKRIPPSV